MDDLATFFFDTEENFLFNAPETLQLESFEDLEEALLRADVGIGVTSELLDGLRAQVAAKCSSPADQRPPSLRDGTAITSRVGTSAV